MSIKQFILKMITASSNWRVFNIKDIDQGISIAAWIEDTLLKKYKQHVRHDATGVVTTYMDNGDKVCQVVFHRQPNAQEIDEVIVAMTPSLIIEYDILQQELFEFLL